MTDPHINLDDVSSTSSSYTSGATGSTADDIPVGNSEPASFGPNLNDFVGGFINMVERLRSQAGIGLGSSFDPLPYESRKHFRASQREFLLGWKAAIDDAIHRIDERELRDNIKRESEKVSPSGTGKGVKIEVEEIED